MSLTNPTDEEMKKMQQDAIKRVEQMNNRANNVNLNIPNNKNYSPNKIKKEEVKQELKQEVEQKVEEKKVKNDHYYITPRSRVFKFLNGENNPLVGIFEKDKEKALLMALLVILMGEETDTYLLLALAYLLM